MTKREQVILGFCGILSLGAVIYYFASMPSTDLKKGIIKSNSGEKQLNSFMQTTRQSMLHKKMDLEMRIIKSAYAESSKDPFFKKIYTVETVKTVKVEVKPKVEQKTKKITAVYSGYIQQHNGAFAIIDGIDYRIGEKLKGSNYLIQSISELKVVLIEDYKKLTRKPKTIILAINKGKLDY